MATFQIRPYQEECLNALRNARQNGITKSTVTMAPGLGKTITSAVDLKNYGKFEKVLFICHNKYILEQSMQIFKEIFGEKYSYGFFCGVEKTYGCNFTFATFQMMAKEYSNFKKDHFDFIIIDEAHHSQAKSWKSVLEYFEPKYLTAWTATPERHDGKKIKNLTGENVFEMSIIDGIAEGYLASVRYLTISCVNIENLPFFTDNRIDPNKTDRGVFFEEKDLKVKQIIEEKMQNFEKPRVMIFCNNISHAENVYKFMGEKAVICHSELSYKQQIKALEGFRSGKYDYIISVDMLNEGIDIPEVNVVVFLRSTESKTIFLQQLGRGLRKISDKDEVIVIDFVDNYDHIKIVRELEEEIQFEVDERIKLQYDKKAVDSMFIFERQYFIFEEDEMSFAEVFLKKYGFEKHIDEVNAYNLYSSECIKEKRILKLSELGENTQRMCIHRFDNFAKIAESVSINLLFENHFSEKQYAEFRKDEISVRYLRKCKSFQKIITKLKTLKMIGLDKAEIFPTFFSDINELAEIGEKAFPNLARETPKKFKKREDILKSIAKSIKKGSNKTSTITILNKFPYPEHLPGQKTLFEILNVKSAKEIDAILTEEGYL